MSLRRMVEVVSRNWLFQRYLPTRSGQVPILVSSEGGLRYLFRSMRRIDPILVANAEEFVRPNDVVWDVGANLGLFAFSAAQIAGQDGRVVAFEPDTKLVEALRASAKKQRFPGAIAVVPAAVAKENSVRTFAIAQRARSSNHLLEYGQTQTGGIREEQTVVCVSLDWSLQHFPAPNVLKIDVEGAELEVLSGAQTVLQKHRPIVLIEVCAETCTEVTELLKQNGYELFDAAVEASLRRPVDMAPWTSVAIPR